MKRLSFSKTEGHREGFSLLESELSPRDHNQRSFVISQQPQGLLEHRSKLQARQRERHQVTRHPQMENLNTLITPPFRGQAELCRT